VTGAYVTNLPSTPAMQRYTTAPSSYVDPVVQQSPTNPWGSSLDGCLGCGMGENMVLQSSNILIGGIIGGGLAYFAPKMMKMKPFTGAIVGAVAAIAVNKLLG